MDDKTSALSRFRAYLDVIATAVMIVAGVAVIWVIARPREAPPASAAAKQRPAIAVPRQPVPLAGAVVKGAADARVALMEFSDFQCPFCGRFVNDTLGPLVQKYVQTGKVLHAFRNLPIESLHPQAVVAAKMALCAEPGGRFWKVHDAFFKQPAARTDQEFRSRALAAGVQTTELDGCLGTSQVADRLSQDIALAKSLGLGSTPVFLIGKVQDGQVVVSKVVPGARPIADFEAAIDAALASVGSAVKEGKPAK